MNNCLLSLTGFVIGYCKNTPFTICALAAFFCVCVLGLYDYQDKQWLWLNSKPVDIL